MLWLLSVLGRELLRQCATRMVAHKFLPLRPSSVCACHHCVLHGGFVPAAALQLIHARGGAACCERLPPGIHLLLLVDGLWLPGFALLRRA